jgi:hypothetical protein
MSLFSGLSRPLKAAGLALVGLAIVAAVIGGITVLNNGGSGDNTAQPPTSSGPSSGVPTSTPGAPIPPTSSSSSAPESPSSPASSSPPASAPPASQGGQPPAGGQPGDQQASAKWVVVRVYNNSLIKGLAERAAEDFRNGGWNVADVSNYPQGIIPETTAYFRPGTDEETAAKALAKQFGMRAEARFQGIQDSTPGVIVIVTNNYKNADGKGGS